VLHIPQKSQVRISYIKKIKYKNKSKLANYCVNTLKNTETLNNILNIWLNWKVNASTLPIYLPSLPPHPNPNKRKLNRLSSNSPIIWVTELFINSLIHILYHYCIKSQDNQGFFYFVTSPNRVCELEPTYLIHKHHRA